MHKLIVCKRYLEDVTTGGVTTSLVKTEPVSVELGFDGEVPRRGEVVMAPVGDNQEVVRCVVTSVRWIVPGPQYAITYEGDHPMYRKCSRVRPRSSAEIVVHRTDLPIEEKEK